MESEAGYRTVYAQGLEYAAIGPEDQLYTVNAESWQRIRVTYDEHPKYHAALSAGHLAWVGHRRKMELQ